MVIINDRALPRDDNTFVIQTGNNMLPQDGTGTPNVSPISTTTTPTTLVIPDRAALLYVKADSDHRVGDNVTLDGTADEGYIVVGTSDGYVPIPCADGNSVYVRADSGTGTVWFYFERV